MSQAKPTIKLVYKRLASAQRKGATVSKTQPVSGTHSHQLSKVPSGVIISENVDPIAQLRPTVKKSTKNVKCVKVT